MIIWGSKGKTKIEGRGTFMCPRCNSLRPYLHHVAGKYFTLYFIPLFKTRTLGEYIECQTCFMTYKPEVLEWSRGRAQADEDIKKVIGEVRKQLESGVPIQFIMQALVEKGLEEQNATQLLFEATNNRIVKCTRCKLAYIGSLSYCQQCGDKLVVV
jgi:hypothetical protein